MRKIDWNSPLTGDDKAWLRTTGILDVERLIEANAVEFDEEYHFPGTEPVGVIKSAVATEPDQGGGNADFSEDDYDDWKVAELSAEIDNRNKVDGAKSVEVVGTGKDGKITKPDLIKALRLWDSENPDVG